MLCLCDQQLSASSLATIGNCSRCVGIIWATRVAEPATEVKKEDSASWAALLIHSPPCLTGREVWVHVESEIWRELLVMLPVMDLSRSSNAWISEERKQGEVRRMYDSLGIAREWERRRRKS